MNRRRFARRARRGRRAITVAHRIHEPAGASLIGDVDAATCARVEDALRVEVGNDDDDDVFAGVYALDLAGPSRANPKPSCGDGDVDAADGETCDDGNLDAFDGCDPDCQAEPFTGCETVIQAEFSAANIAWIDARTWLGFVAGCRQEVHLTGERTCDVLSD